jgi:chromosome segregation ATPase
MEVADLNLTIAQKRELINKLSLTVDEIKQQNEIWKTENESTKLEKEKLVKEYAEFQTNYANLSNEVAGYEARKKDLLEQNQRLNQEINEVARNVELKQRELIELQENIEAKRQEYSAIVSDTNKFNQDLKAREEMVTELEARLNDYKKQLDLTKTVLENRENMLILEKKASIK